MSFSVTFSYLWSSFSCRPVHHSRLVQASTIAVAQTYDHFTFGHFICQSLLCGSWAANGRLTLFFRVISPLYFQVRSAPAMLISVMFVVWADFWDFNTWSGMNWNWCSISRNWSGRYFTTFWFGLIESPGTFWGFPGMKFPSMCGFFV